MAKNKRKNAPQRDKQSGSSRSKKMKKSSRRYERFEILSAMDDFHHCKYESLRATAKAYEIPESTLRGYITKHRTEPLHIGKPRIIPKEDEDLLEAYLIKSAELGVPKSRFQVGDQIVSC